MTFYFIDISRYNGAINYAQVKAGGIQGVVCKATEGTPAQTASATSAYFQTAAAAIKRAGFPIRGGYHWLRPGNYAAQAANFYNVLVAGYGTINGLVCQLDAEGTDVRLDDVQGFIRSWNLLTGNYPLCGYFPKWYWQGKGVAAGQLLPLVSGRWWQSAYVTGSGTYLALADKIASGWDPWGSYSPLILQFTSTANIPGDPGVCDVNMVKGTVASFLGAAVRVPKPPAPKPVTPSSEDEVKLVMEAGNNSVYLAGVTPAGKYRLYVSSAEFADMQELYGAVVTVDDLDHCGPVVSPATKNEAPEDAQTERRNRRAEA